jgi:multidrug efflux pump subunit AcrA (membrane-fusion protein)
MHKYLLLALPLVLAGCGAPVKSAAPVRLDPEVKVVHPEKRTLVRRVDQPGVIEAYERTAVYTKVSGYVRKWYVDVGDRVKKDMLLVEIEVPELVEELQQKQALVVEAQAAVNQAHEQQAIAEATLAASVDEIAEAEATVKRAAADVELRDLQAKRMARLVESQALQQELLDEARKSLGSARAGQDGAVASVRTKKALKATSEASVKKAAADVIVAEAKVKVAEADARRLAALVSYTKITAPYDGIITDRNVSTGDFVRPGTGDPSEGRAAEAQSSTRATPLYLLARVDRVMFVVGIPELDSAFVHPGSDAMVRVQALGTEMAVPVSRVSRRLESQSRTLQAQIDLPNADGKLMPGMYATGTVKIERQGVPAVPTSAVVETGEQTYCYLLDGGKAVRTPVQVGISDGTWIELRRKRVTTPTDPSWADINGQEPIIVGDLSELTDGAPVRVR